jgi:hypothetical protein
MSDDPKPFPNPYLDALAEAQSVFEAGAMTYWTFQILWDKAVPSLEEAGLEDLTESLLIFAPEDWMAKNCSDE